ncbi:MAG: cytochrome c oxidase assembly protein [Firmicutes bacterium]|nr:cytochrome c oxidase assembly protein [Bacillota bacterium]
MLPPGAANAGFFSLWHPEVMLLVIIIGVTYRQVAGPVRSRFDNASAVPARRQWAMYCSLFTLCLAVGTPLPILADQFLLTAHMIQFVLLAMVLPPLFLIGLPDWLVESVLKLSYLKSVIKFLTKPGVALIMFTVVFSIFQLPNLLETTLKYNGLYIVDEYLMMLASIFLWWPVYSPSKSTPGIRRSLT